MNGLWIDIECLKKVSKTNLYSYSLASAKTQMKSSTPNLINYRVCRTGNQLKIVERSDATCRNRKQSNSKHAREGLIKIPITKINIHT